MLGRAAMDSPAIFADVDRFFYGEATNPCRTRREVLEKYSEYLARLYPAQCGPGCCPVCGRQDDTNDHQHQSVEVKVLSGSSSDVVVLKDDSAMEEGAPSTEPRSAAAAEPSASSTSTTASEMLSHQGTSTKRRRARGQNADHVLISTGVVGRCTKPVLGLFWKMAGNRQFRRDLDTFSRDLSIRNCGPGYILRRAVGNLPDDVLDMPFEQVEDVEVERTQEPPKEAAVPETKTDDTADVNAASASSGSEDLQHLSSSMQMCSMKEITENHEEEAKKRKVSPDCLGGS
ncbi:unnamed protein product [Amoebophrya sp. A25]|nr:unnamed protein product [Amoebophrya sp. A25]|eukprot:GSA25T00026885001.1